MERPTFVVAFWYGGQATLDSDGDREGLFEVLLAAAASAGYLVREADRENGLLLLSSRGASLASFAGDEISAVVDSRPRATLAARGQPSGIGRVSLGVKARKHLFRLLPHIGTEVRFGAREHAGDRWHQTDAGTWYWLDEKRQEWFPARPAKT